MSYKTLHMSNHLNCSSCSSFDNLLNNKVIQPSEVNQLSQSNQFNCNQYKLLNISDDKTYSNCFQLKYGSDHNYIKDKSNRKFGVPLGCQKIF